LDDDGVVAHRAADETALSRKCRGRALAHHPQIAAVVVFPPGIIVMVVHHVRDGASDDLAHALDDPLAPGVAIPARKLHCGDVSASEFAVLVDHGWRDVHAVLAACCLEVARGAGVPKPAASE